MRLSTWRWIFDWIDVVGLWRLEVEFRAPRQHECDVVDLWSGKFMFTQRNFVGHSDVFASVLCLFVREEARQDFLPDESFQSIQLWRMYLLISCLGYLLWRRAVLISWSSLGLHRRIPVVLVWRSPRAMLGPSINHREDRRGGRRNQHEPLNQQSESQHHINVCVDP